jgi:hypothetical protein
MFQRTGGRRSSGLRGPASFGGAGAPQRALVRKSETPVTARSAGAPAQRSATPLQTNKGARRPIHPPRPGAALTSVGGSPAPSRRRAAATSSASDALSPCSRSTVACGGARGEGRGRRGRRRRAACANGLLRLARSSRACCSPPSLCPCPNQGSRRPTPPARPSPAPKARPGISPALPPPKNAPPPLSRALPPRPAPQTAPLLSPPPAPPRGARPSIP